MTRITIPLELDEEKALAEFARHEKRDIRQQAAMLLRIALEQSGYLQPIKAHVYQEDQGDAIKLTKGCVRTTNGQVLEWSMNPGKSVVIGMQSFDAEGITHPDQVIRMADSEFVIVAYNNGDGWIKYR